MQRRAPSGGFLRRRDVAGHNKNLFKILDLLLLAKIETPALPRAQLK